MRQGILSCIFAYLPVLLPAQSFSAGKNLHELQQSLYAGTPFRQVSIVLQPEQRSRIPAISRIFLPKWTSDALPMFCKIEHKMGKKMAVPFKFRLGSVEYVDRMEYPGRWGVE